MPNLIEEIQEIKTEIAESSQFKRVDTKAFNRMVKALPTKSGFSHSVGAGSVKASKKNNTKVQGYIKKTIGHIQYQISRAQEDMADDDSPANVSMQKKSIARKKKHLAELEKMLDTLNKTPTGYEADTHGISMKFRRFLLDNSYSY